MNAARGETPLTIGGQVRTLCLTLGGLAEVEAGLGCTTLAELDVRMRALSAADMLIVLRALLSEDDVAGLSAADIAPGEAARAIAEAFRLGLAS